MADEDRSRALVHIREIRDQLHHRAGVRRPLVDDVHLPEPVEDEGALGSEAVKYQLELAAHRETTQRLLDEKDRTIEALEALVQSLRDQLDRADRDYRVE